MDTTLRIGTRGSALALWQARHVKALIEAAVPGTAAEIRIIKTSGDLHQDVPLAQLDKGMFIREIERALLDGEVDLAVHSLKDLPTRLPDGLALGATPTREDVRDCYVTRSGAPLEALPSGAVVGTSSLRRQAQLGHRFRTLRFADIRGNVETRLRKMREGEYDAVVLALAGVKRLDMADVVTGILDTETLLPAVGQAALGLEVRSGDPAVTAIVGRLDDAETRAAVVAERALLRRLEGGCRVPVGAWARAVNGLIELDACVAAPDGSVVVRNRASGSLEEAAAVGVTLAETLLADGADAILRCIGIDASR